MSLRAADGVVAERTWLRWHQRPSAAAVLHTLTRLAYEVKGHGYELRIDQSPVEVTALLAFAGLSTPHGPIDTCQAVIASGSSNAGNRDVSRN